MTILSNIAIKTVLVVLPSTFSIAGHSCQTGMQGFYAGTNRVYVCANSEDPIGTRWHEIGHFFYEKMLPENEKSSIGMEEEDFAEAFSYYALERNTPQCEYGGEFSDDCIVSKVMVRKVGSIISSRQ